MKFFEVIKRLVPFAAALAIGVVIALPFASAPVYDEPADAYEADEYLRSENERLKEENCRMKWQMKRLERSSRFDRELTVPEPPMPPMAPIAPMAPEAPEAPAPPAPPAAPVTRTDR